MLINFKKIEIVIIDCDGVLTDGQYILSETGCYSKSFYTRDFRAIGRLLEKNIELHGLNKRDNVKIFNLGMTSAFGPKQQIFN